jgi:hypothetical protein
LDSAEGKQGSGKFVGVEEGGVTGGAGVDAAFEGGGKVGFIALLL